MSRAKAPEKPLSAKQLKAEQIVRIVKMVHLSGTKGKNEKAICYSEERFHQVGAQYTKNTLQELVAAGVLVRDLHGTRRFKTISEKEKKQIIRYWHADFKGQEA